MTTQEVADKLVLYCREGKNFDAINELYDDNVVSREVEGTPNSVINGKDAVIAKNQAWYDSVVEIHSGTVSDPLVAIDHFSVRMEMDVTYKEFGRGPMTEIAVYEVKNGKIVSEQFFYKTDF